MAGNENDNKPNDSGHDDDPLGLEGIEQDQADLEEIVDAISTPKVPEPDVKPDVDQEPKG